MITIWEKKDRVKRSKEKKKISIASNPYNIQCGDTTIEAISASPPLYHTIVNIIMHWGNIAFYYYLRRRINNTRRMTFRLNTSLILLLLLLPYSLLYKYVPTLLSYTNTQCYTEPEARTHGGGYGWLWYYVYSLVCTFGVGACVLVYIASSSRHIYIYTHNTFRFLYSWVLPKNIIWSY